MSEPLRLVDGYAAALPTHNVDTDVIMPKRFLRTITRAGLGDGFLADLRAEPGFVLNREPWRQARILVVGDNFGCGSSREHAVWGLSQFGIRVLLGTGYAGIFYDNCRSNGIAAISLPAADRDSLLRLAADPDSARFEVDIAAQRIRHRQGTVAFSLPAEIRDDLLAGRDAIGKTLERVAAIQGFEETRLGRA